MRFIVFHDVDATEAAAFETKLRFLRDHTNVIALDDFLDGEFCPKSPNVVITFDDGYRGWSAIAAPALKRLALPATFFIASGFVGLDRQREAAFMRDRLLISGSSTGSLSAAEVRLLALDGFTIGGHTRSHLNLGLVSEPTVVEQELKEDKRRLEEIIGKPVRHFAYPFGACQNPSLDLSTLLQRAGFHSASTLVGGFNSRDTNPFKLRRDLTSASLALSAFKARVLGNQDPVTSFKRYFVRRRASILTQPAP